MNNNKKNETTTDAPRRFMNITTLSSLFNWLTLFLATIQFRKGYIAQGVKTEELPFTSKLLPYAAYYGVFMVSIFIGPPSPLPSQAVSRVAS